MKNILRLEILGRLLIPLLLLALTSPSTLPHGAAVAFKQAELATRFNDQKGISLRLSQAASYFPWRADLWEAAGLRALQGGDPQLALEYFNKTASIRPLSPKSQVAVGEAYAESGDLPAAIEAWERALQDLGPSSRVYQLLGQAHLTRRDYPAAIQSLKVLVVINPRDASLQFQLGILLSATQPEAASPYLVQAADLEDGYHEQSTSLLRSINTARLAGEPAFTLLAAGRTLASQGHWELAAEAFRQATVLRPDYAEAWAFLGEALQHPPNHNEDPQAGLSELQKALELDPNSLVAQTLLSLYWRRQGDFEQARLLLQRAAKLDPENLAILSDLGQVIAAQGDLSSAIDLYQRAIQTNPRDIAYWKLLAAISIQYRVQVEDLGLPAARQAVILSPEDPQALDLMGQALYFTNDLANAERFLIRSLTADPTYALARLHLAQVYIVKGESQIARQQLDLAQTQAPGTPVGEQAQRLINRFFP